MTKSRITPVEDLLETAPPPDIDGIAATLQDAFTRDGKWFATCPLSDAHPDIRGTLCLSPLSCSLGCDPKKIVAARPALAPLLEPIASTIIDVHDDHALLTDQILDLLKHSHGLGIFARGKVLVRVSSAPSFRKKFARASDSPAASRVMMETLRNAVSRLATFRKLTTKGERPALPPAWACQAILERENWPLPFLQNIVETPVFMESGDILQTPGLHEDSGLLFVPSTTFDPIPENPTLQDAQAAAQEILTLFSDFPFEDTPTGQACLLAAILTLAGKFAIPPPYPIFGVTANAPGTGKSLLARAAAIIGTGRDPVITSMPDTQEELQKHISALLLECAPAAVIDNARPPIDSHHLECLATSPEFNARILGITKTVTLPSTTTIFITGNNLSYARELPRRIVPIRLHATCEFPEERTNFAIPDFIPHLLNHRHHLCTLPAIILRAFHLALRPQSPVTPLGSYEAWDALVRHATLWLGLPDLHAPHRALRTDPDSEFSTIANLLASIHSHFASNPFSIRQLAAATDLNPNLLDAISRFSPRSTFKGPINVPVLSKALARIAGRIANSLSLQKFSVSDGIQSWAIFPSN